MGEQTQSQPQSESSPQPQNVPSSQSQPSPPTTEDTARANIPHKPPNSSKIPVRPNKLRKLSSSAAASAPTPSPAAADVEEEEKPKSNDGSPSQALTVVKDSAASTVAKNKRRVPSQSPRALPVVIKPLSAEGEIELALRHLRSVDPLLVDLINSLPPPTFDSHQPPFLALTKSILYQQLAYKAGTSIYTKFVELCGGEAAVLPDTVLALSAPQLRQVGVSGRKATYLFDLAHKYKTGILSDTSIVAMDDKSLFTMLSMVKGIGSWSVHMFMIFSLHRPDVLPVSDIGVRKGVQILYGLEDLPRPSQMEQLCQKWKPYRSVGSWYMWRLVEGKGTPQAGAMPLEGMNVMPLQQQMGQLQEETQHHQQQHQLQLLEPITGNANFGACIWGQ